jgi:hypothetical protein
MFRHLTLRRLVAPVLLAAGFTFGSTGTAEACHGYYYRTVTNYVTVERPVAYWVTLYDDYGDAYQVRQVNYRTVRVPYTRQVKVYY